MSNVPASFGTTLSTVVLAIIFGIIVFAAGTFVYYRKKWAAKKGKDGGKDEEKRALIGIHLQEWSRLARISPSNAGLLLRV